MIGRRGGLAIAVGISLAGVLSSQSYSALRAPKESVFASFPEADGYRAIVRPVDKRVRAEVQERLPFKIHFNELGDHTVYAALRGERPLGVIHPRTEEGTWGLIEIEWCLNLDLTVRGFKFHRCRSRYRETVEQSAFAKSLIGLDVRQLSSLLTDHGKVSTKAGTIPHGGEELAAIVVKSAIKTLILTRSAWRLDIERLLDMDLGLRTFPNGVTIRRLHPPQHSKPRQGPIHKVRALRARDRKNKSLGRIISTEVKYGPGTLELEWVFDPNGRIQRVDSVSGWPDAKTRTEFKQLEGRLVNTVEAGSGEASRVAFELLAIVDEMKEAGAK